LKIIQLSDFHISSKTDLDECKTKINRLCKSVNQECNNTEELLFVVCGDITDRGATEGYENAKVLFDFMKNELEDKNFSYEFVPGNHDLCNKKFIEFDNFIAGYLINDKYSYEENNVALKNYGDIHVVLVNSVSHRDYVYGKLPIEELSRVLSGCNKPIVIVMHHTLMSRYEDDHSAIVNAYKFIELIEKYHVVAVLHGHTHGYSDISVSNGCKIIGVGPFLKKIEDVNNQYNIVKIISGEVQEVDNFRYSSDLDQFDKKCVYIKKNINIFKGSKTTEVYERVRKSTLAYGCINNLNINITSLYSDFVADMEQSFEGDIEKAKDWQSLDVPETLYYNHGQYMKLDNNDGISYAINELINKATSSRAIIPLISFKDVFGSEDNHLPSLDIIQFGFFDEEKTELFCTLYLRALEVNHFLRINLSEIYIMSKKIQEAIRSINKININIFAFRAQYKEKFSCFKKAKIDMLAERNIMKIVMEKQISKIEELIKEKLELLETVVNIEGVLNLYNCLKDSEDEYYTPELIDSCFKLTEAMKNLKSECKKTSNYQEVKKIEAYVSSRMEDFIKKIGELKGES